jgi:hypothetical protein
MLAHNLDEALFECVTDVLIASYDRLELRKLGDTPECKKHTYTERRLSNGERAKEARTPGKG